MEVSILVRRFFRTQSLAQKRRIFKQEFDVPRHGGIRNRDKILKRVNDFCVRGTPKPVCCVFFVSHCRKSIEGLKNPVQQS
jgi:hypothetical protein